MEQPLRICYLGITDPAFSRAGVYIGALRAQGVVVHECFDSTPGWRKFWRLYKKHHELRHAYDVLIVGYPGALVVPLARLISKRPIIFDAGWTLFEGVVLARGHHAHNPFARFFLWCIDRAGHLCADLVLLDSDEQISFYCTLMRVSRKKLRRLYTGCDERNFYYDETLKKTEQFTAVFRGKHNHEAGLSVVLQAGRLLEREGIALRIYSPGYVPEEAIPSNVSIQDTFLPFTELRTRMSECHVSIGQMAKHERLHHSIPHKAFESCRMGLPYISAYSRALKEFLGQDKGMYVPPEDPRALAQALIRIRNNPELATSLAEAGMSAYAEKASWQVLANTLVGFVQDVRAK